ncbi:MAG: DUF4129 domain-containing protein [Anaerolineaceae bacterium]|nr:DUF4129 domain-containing protein [Anaerolineaceae bacterium]
MSEISKPSPTAFKNKNGRLWIELSALAALLLEFLPLVAFFSQLASPQQTTLRSIFLMGFGFIFGYYFLRYINELSINLWVKRLLYFLWILATLLLSLRLIIFPGTPFNVFLFIQLAFQSFATEGDMTSFWALFAMIILNWRIVSLSNRVISLAQVQSRFSIGLILFLLAGTIFKFELYSLPNYFFLFFIFIGLTGSGISRILRLSEEVGGKLPYFEIKRVLWIALAALLIVFAGFLFRNLLSESITTAMAKLIQWSFQGLMYLTVGMLYPLLMVFFWLFEMFLKFISKFFSPAESAQNLAQILEDINTMEEQVQTSSGLNLRPLLLIGILLIIIIITLYILRRNSWKLKLNLESDSSKANQKDNRKGNPFLELWGDNPLKRFNRYLAAAKIRRIYAGLMQLCAKLEHSRPEAATPLEFLPELEKIFSQHKNELHIITEAYLRIRYGELPETENEVQLVMQSWKLIEKQGKEILEEKRKLIKAEKKKKKINKNPQE